VKLAQRGKINDNRWYQIPSKRNNMYKIPTTVPSFDHFRTFFEYHEEQKAKDLHAIVGARFRDLVIAIQLAKPSAAHPRELLFLVAGILSLDISEAAKICCALLDAQQSYEMRAMANRILSNQEREGRP
jgi:hypothetical protein